MLAEKNIRFRITELDIRLKLPSVLADKIEQAKMYYNLVKICQSYSNFDGFSMWGVAYPNSWMPGFYPGYGEALLFDHNYQPTLAYNAVIQALQGEEFSGSNIQS